MRETPTPPKQKEDGKNLDNATKNASVAQLVRAPDC